MVNDKANANEHNEASVIRNSMHTEKAEAHGRFEVECIGADGKLKWTDTIENTVTTVGKNDLYAFWNLSHDVCEQDFCVETENPVLKCVTV